MERTEGRILVIRGGAIGDFILTLPVFAALRERFPKTHLEVLGYPHIASLALAGGLVDGVQSIEARALAGFFARNGTLDERLTRYFQSFEVAISYLYDPDEIFRVNFERCSKAQFHQGPHRPDESKETHATEVFLKPLERLAIYNADPVPKLALPTTATPDGSPAGSLRPAEASGTPTAPWIAMHPGSGSEQKNWPEENWNALLRRIASDTNWNLLIVGGEAEGDRVDRLARLLPPSRVALARSLRLTDLAARLGGCDFFLGHDSGIAHIAAAVGLRGFALWGKTNASIWSPRGDGVTILKAEHSLARLGVDAVFLRLVGAVPA
jgi:ADP-heptose:LPS heptosyltransferase